MIDDQWSYLIYWVAMQIFVKDNAGESIVLDASPDMEIENFKAMLEVLNGVPAASIQLYHNNVELTDNQKCLQQYNVQEGSILTYKLKSAGRLMYIVRVRDSKLFHVVSW